MILPEYVSREVSGPVVRQGDEQWFSIVRWVLNALIAAEELGITADNAAGLRGDTAASSISAASWGSKATSAKRWGSLPIGASTLCAQPATTERCSKETSVRKRHLLLAEPSIISRAGEG